MTAGPHRQCEITKCTCPGTDCGLLIGEPDDRVLRPYTRRQTLSEQGALTKRRHQCAARPEDNR